MDLLGERIGLSDGENQIENPKTLVFVAFDSLIVTEYCDAVGESVVVNVDETGAEKSDCCVNVGNGDGDGDGQSGCG